MKQSTYLYGADLKPYQNTPYCEVLFLKIRLAKTLLYTLVHTDNMQDHTRINDVNSAIKFNRELLLELGYSEPDIAKLLRKPHASNP